MRKKIFTFLLALAASVGLSWAAPAVAVNGKLPGAFSVGESTVVYFSQGNLKYTKSTGKFEFMTNQYDMVETNNQNVGTDYAKQDVITLFGWGTSGWDNTAADATSVHYQPYSTCKTIHNSNANINNYQYGPSNANVVGSSKAASAESWSKSDSYKNYDWGVFNSGDLGSGWRVLTTQEWGYLLGSTSPARTNAANLRTLATVNSVPGLIIMPDGWTASGVSLTVTTSKYTTNNINLTNWSTLEEQGCVFLPAAGYREGTSVMSNVGTRGFYWSSSAYSANYAYVLRFYSNSFGPQEINGRYDGCSVRLVSETAPSGGSTPANVCGDGLTWELSEGVLTISYDGVGTGVMDDWGGYNEAPWSSEKLQITSVVLPEGITTIGSAAFRGCTNLASVNMAENFPASLTTIKTEAFYNSALTSVTIPANVVNIYNNVFYGCQSIANVYCYANPNDLVWMDGYCDDFKSGNKVTQCHVKNCYLSLYNTKWNTGYDLTDVNVTFVGDLPGDCGSSTFIDADFAINFMNDPYIVVGGGDLPEGVLVEGIPNKDINHGYYDVIITIPAKAGTYKVTLGTCGWGLGNGTIKNENGSTTYASFNQHLADNDLCYHQDPTNNIVTAIFTLPEDQNIIVDCGEYTPYFSIEASSAPTPTPSGDGGKLSGAFSVASGTQVYFSQGNLQYQASTNTWRFAENQYEAVGASNGSGNTAPYNNTSSANHSPSASQTGWIDLFGWAASGISRTGVNAYQPYSTSTQNADYGTTSTKSASETLGNYDWGKNMGDDWRTLTAEEWGYLIGPGNGGNDISAQRANYQSLRGLCKITVSGTDYPGMIILPDDMYNNLPTEGDIASKWAACAVAAGSLDYTLATFTEAEWTALQAAGAVFLPAAGYRNGTTVNYAGFYGFYWSSSAASNTDAFGLDFSMATLLPEFKYGRYYGFSVRLVSETAPSGGSTPSTPEIKLNANFGGTYDWADTEAFTDNSDGTATLSNIALEAGYYYNFSVNVGDEWFSINHELTRENPSCVISNGEGIYYFQADVTGNYSFTWEYATNTLTIGYPEIQHTYTAVGQNLAVFGNSWDPSITANDLVLQEDGSYKWEKEKVSFTGAITIQYRVCEDHAWGVAYPATSEDAATFEIPSLGDYKITITYNPVGNVISASAEKIAKPTIQLNGNFSGEWADTEAFEVVEQPMDSYAKLTKLLEPGTYEFGVKVNGELRANGSAYTRDNYSYIIEEGNTGNLTINVDVKGYYSFFWYYDDNRLAIDYSRVCGMYWKDVTAGNFEVTLGQEGEVTLPKVWATSMAFVSNIANGVDQVRLGSTDETVATIAYTLSMDGLGTLTFHQAGECDIYVVHDITDYYCYDSCAFHLTVHPAAPVGPTYLDADFAIDFMSDPYTVVGGGALPTGVEVEGSMNTGDSQHGYRLPVITIPVTAGNYKVMMGTCSYSNQDATVKTEDGSHTYATLATNNGTCYHNNTTANVVGAIFNVPSDQIIKVYGAEYTPFFSIEKMAAVPAFTDFEINFQSDPYIVISGAKPEGTVIIGTYHDNLHGYQNVEAVVPVEAGNYRLTVGACQYGTPGNVMSETNAELASFNSNLGEGNCYHNNTAANIVSTIFTVDMDQTITINGGAYMPYMKLEKLLDNTYYINFENAEGAIGTVPGEIAIAAGESWTIPANLTLYKEGYTFVGWSDGVNTYAPGDEFFPNAHGTLQAVYTANSVSIADASTINVKWYFGESNGAPSVTWNGVAGYLLAKGEVDGQMIDLKLDIDATSGKFHNAGRGDKWAQVNANTVFTFPSKEGAVVNVETYSGNATYDLAAGTLTCNTNDYYSYLEVVYPAPTTAVVIGDPNDADQVTAFLNTYEGQTVPDLTIDRPVLNNMYNTLCLPFHMDADQIANSSLNGVEIYEFVDVDVTNDELYLYTSEQKHEIVAGRPYLVKFSAASQLDDLNFINVVINNANLDDQAVTIKGVTFKGTFQPVVLGAQEGLDFNGGHLFLMANNTLMWPNTDNPLKPFRAYFTVNVDAGQSAGMPVRRGMPAHIGGPAQIPTGVENVQGDNVQSTKVVENGVLYIIKNGVKYNAQGQVVK